MGGGSGGHITPNLAVATELKNRIPSIKLAYIGSRNKIAAQLVQKSGIQFYPIFAGKLRRYFSFQNFIDPIFVIIGFFQSLYIIIKFWPRVIFSKGGYVSLPVALAAFILRRPLVLHESDSRMGIANRIASKIAKKVCVAFPDLAAQDEKYVLTGNPIRSSIMNGNPKIGYQITGFVDTRPIVLVWGGSQGAQQINEIIEREFQNLKYRFQIIHITGKGKAINITNPSYCSFEYINEDLKHIYAITDFVVGRSGANSLFELAIMEKPNITIPINNTDQLLNSAYFEIVGGSLVLRDDQSLYDLLVALSENPHKQEMIIEALRSIARPDSADEIAKIILNTK